MVDDGEVVDDAENQGNAQRDCRDTCRGDAGNSWRLRSEPAKIDEECGYKKIHHTTTIQITEKGPAPGYSTIGASEQASTVTKPVCGGRTKTGSKVTNCAGGIRPEKKVPQYRRGRVKRGSQKNEKFPSNNNKTNSTNQTAHKYGAESDTKNVVIKSDRSKYAIYFLSLGSNIW